MKRLFVLALMCSCLVFLPPSAGIAHTPVPTVPAASAKLWMPLVYHNRTIPRVVWSCWSRSWSQESIHYCRANLSFENGTQHRIQIDSYTVNFLDANGRVVSTYTRGPGNLLWVLDPGEKIALYTGEIPTPGEIVNVHTDVAWHPTDERFVILDVVETEVIKCSDLGTWHELHFRVRNSTDRIVQQATVLAYAESPASWEICQGECQGDISQRWVGKQLLLSPKYKTFPLEPGEEFTTGTRCAGYIMWLDTYDPLVKVIARWNDTSPYPPPYPYPTIYQVSGSATN